jgi:hypothetical protein
MLGSSRVAAQLAASREGLSSMSDDDDEILFIFQVVSSFFSFITTMGKQKGKIWALRTVIKTHQHLPNVNMIQSYPWRYTSQHCYLKYHN